MSNFFTLKVNNNGNSTNWNVYTNGNADKGTNNAYSQNQESSQQRELNDLRNILSNNNFENSSEYRKDENTGFNFDSLG
jgi:hypothetical protein